MAKPTEVPGLSSRAWAKDAARALAGARLEDVHHHKKRVRATPERGAVHDLRVATRRLRAALGLFGGTKAVDGRVKELQDALGAVRDAQLELDAIEPPHGARHTDGRDAALLDELHAGLTAELAQRNVELFEALDHWDEGGAKAVEDAVHGLEPRGRLGGHRVRQHLRRRVRRLGKALVAALPELDATCAHRLRIAAKRLRYELELLTPAFPALARVLLPELQAMQDGLGALHDLDVRLDHLLLVDAARGEGAPRDGGSRTIHALVEERERLAAQVRERLERLEADRSLKVLRARLKKPAAGARASAPPAADPG